MANIITDTITGTTGDLLSAHVPDNDPTATWIIAKPGDTIKLFSTFGGICASDTNTGPGAMYYSNKVMPDNDASLRIGLKTISAYNTAGNGSGIFGDIGAIMRVAVAGVYLGNETLTGYMTYYRYSDNTWYIDRMDSDTSASPGNFIQAFTPLSNTAAVSPLVIGAAARFFDITCAGSNPVVITVKEGATVVATASDSSAGRHTVGTKFGIRAKTLQGNDPFLDYFQADSYTAAADTTPPVLTSPTGTSTGATTASGTVTTDEANGTLYFLATTNSTETATTVKASGGTQAITTTGSKSVSFTGLTASTVYYAHYVHTDAASNDSTAVNSTSFTTAAPDTTAPVLTTPTGTQTGSTTASGTVVTDEANGTLYSLATTNATESAATVKATGATQAITTTGTKTVAATGLTAATVYYLHYVHRDASGNDSTVANSASFTTTASDTTAPILSSPAATTTGTTTASGSVSTDEANGTLYRLASVNATETAATVKTAALTTTVTATGVQSITFTGLTSGIQYYAHYVHRDAAGNDSAVSNSAAFTTTAVTITYAVAGKNIMGGKRLGVAHHVTVHDKTTRALVATKTGLTSDATTGIVTFTHASLIAGTEYMIMPISDADVKDTGFFWATAT